MNLKWMGIYKVTKDVAGFKKGDKVEIRELRDDINPNHVYIYGINGGSGYIRRDLLKQS